MLLRLYTKEHLHLFLYRKTEFFVVTIFFQWERSTGNYELMKMIYACQ